MDTLERAIRAALEKGDASDRAYREKVYRSALAALERAVANAPPEAGQERRASLQDAITRIEREHLPVAPRPAPEMPAPAIVPEPVQEPRAAMPEQQARPADLDDARPVRAAARQEPAYREPELDIAPETPTDDYRDDYRDDGDFGATVVGEKRPTRRGGSYAWMFIVITVIAILAVGGWWAVNSGILAPASQTRSQASGPSSGQGTGRSGTGSAAPRADADDVDPTAITLFTPEEPGDISTPGDAVAEVVGEGDAAMLRIRSGRSGSAIAFNVPQETLSQLAGRRAVFVVSARADNDEATQISVSCSFGEMGDCGRQRYDVGSQRSDFIFDVDLPSVQPGSDGTIAIVSDIDNAGKALDIYAIRVSAD